MITIRAICQECGKIAIFTNSDYIELDIAQNARFGISANDEASLSIVCPKCNQFNDFALIVEQDENYSLELKDNE